MNSTVSAVYQQGVFRPLEPLTLPESTQVQVQLFAPKHRSAFQHRLMGLYDLLTDLTEEQRIEAAPQIFSQILQSDLKMLWYLCKPSLREFCAMLELSAMNLDARDLTPPQIAAFRFGLERMQQEQVTQADLDTCYELLVESGLPPSFGFDEEIVHLEGAGWSPLSKRVPNLHAGLIHVSEDFDDPLPDSFWLGEEAIG